MSDVAEITLEEMIAKPREIAGTVRISADGGRSEVIGIGSRRRV